MIGEPLVRAGKRYGLTMAEAEEGCRVLIEKLRPVAISEVSFASPWAGGEEFESLVQRAAKAHAAAVERRERQAAFVLFGIHL